MVSDFSSRYCNVNSFFLNFHAWKLAVQSTHHTLHCITQKCLYLWLPWKQLSHFSKCFHTCFMFSRKLWSAEIHSLRVRFRVDLILSCQHVLAHTNIPKFNTRNKAVITTFTDKKVTWWWDPPSLTVINTGFFCRMPTAAEMLAYNGSYLSAMVYRRWCLWYFVFHPRQVCSSIQPDQLLAQPALLFGSDMRGLSFRISAHACFCLARGHWPRLPFSFTDWACVQILYTGVSTRHLVDD